MKIQSPWFQLCASLIAMIMIANLQYAWTLFVGPLREGNGWTLSDVQWAFTLFILFQTWIQPLDGWLIDRLGPRLFISAAGVLCGLGWAGLAYADTLPMLYTFYATAGIGAALVYSGSIGSALKWFKKRRGLATGILAAGFGGGTALFIPLIAWTIANHGYQTAFIGSGLIQGIQRAKSLSPPWLGLRNRRRPCRSAISRLERCFARRSSTCCTSCSS
jgi:OFA family oxalate/formate antiporter-like MFS transporter